jgi:hypothetical protein
MEQIGVGNAIGAHGALKHFYLPVLAVNIAKRLKPISFD